MSRDRNNLQRHIEDCLTVRHEMREWISRAQALSPFDYVTESDWIRYGDLPPHHWLYDRELDESDSWVDWDWDDETWDAPELNECPPDWLRNKIEDRDWRSLQEDWEEDWEPRDLEFGGRYYPAEHVHDVRNARWEAMD